MTDTTIVRLWPLPRMFQIFFIGIAMVTMCVAVWPQLVCGVLASFLTALLLINRMPQSLTT